jgi:serine/threonine-protein kinase
MEDLVGRILKRRYRIDASIDRGGMSEVYRAFDLRRSYPVAVKVMCTDLAEYVEFFDRFQAEARRLKRLTHQNIVRFYEFAQERLLIFLVMGFAEGITLRRRIFEAEGACPWRECKKRCGKYLLRFTMLTRTA